MPENRYETILSQLICFDTTSRNSNLELIGFISEYLRGYGIVSTLVPNEEGDKASLYAIVGPAKNGGIGLSAHTDVVPVDGQLWKHDPFALTYENGRYYGRGTTDMKGFLACSLALVPELVQMDLRIPIHLLYSYDEEIGCLGVQPMINNFGASLVQPKMVIVGEPTEMQVAEAHKGIYAFKTEVTGKEAHSSMPDIGVNAVFYASRMIVELERIGGEVRDVLVDERFEPPFSTMHVGTIQGGTALNIVPKECSFIWEIRSLPSANVEAIRQKVFDIQESLSAEMQKIDSAAGIQTTQVNYVPAFQATKDGDGEELITLALGCARFNELGTAPYGTEAGWFEKKGCPTVVCGPGSIKQAHQPDEFIEKSQLDQCMQFLRKVVQYAAQ